MFTERSGKQNRLEMVVLEELVPQDHLLRKIDATVDFSFINKICKPYYCENNGRPAIEPEVLFRMLFIGYLYGIRSEIRLLKEIEVNVAYRWFIGYDLTEKLPDLSVIRQNRLRRYKNTDVPQQIFDEIVRQAMAKGLVGGKILYSDSTHLKAKGDRCANCPKRGDVSVRSRKERAYAVTYGKISRIWRMPLPIRKRVRVFTREERKRWSVALPIPKNYTASVIAVCGGFLRLPSSACLLPPCRI